VSRACQPSL